LAKVAWGDGFDLDDFKTSSDGLWLDKELGILRLLVKVDGLFKNSLLVLGAICLLFNNDV
jgi:hypothetical protein